MTAPCHEQVVAAAFAALAAISGVSGLAVLDQPDRPVDALPVIALRVGDEAPEDIFAGELGFALEIGVTCYAADRAALAVLRAKAQQALLADLTLGGLTRDLRLAGEGPPVMDTEEGHDAAIGTELRFTLHYATREDDPFAFA